MAGTTVGWIEVPGGGGMVLLADHTWAEVAVVVGWEVGVGPVAPVIKGDISGGGTSHWLTPVPAGEI